MSTNFDQLYPNLKVALVYDRVNTPYGGAEKVLLALHKIFPQAPLFTSVYDKKQALWADVFEVKSSFLQKIVWAKKHHRFLAPLMPIAFESFDFSEFDIIISVTSAEAKGIITKSRQLHVCYLLTPPRYLYSHRKISLNSRKIFSTSWGKWLIYKLLNYLRWWDQVAIRRPDAIIPISQRVAKRVKKYYSLNIEEVIYPPVEMSLSEEKKSKKTPTYSHTDILPYYLVVSRLVYYKKIDLVIKACQKLKRNLIVVGDGPELKNLQKLAKKNNSRKNSTSAQIIFKKNLTSTKLNNLYNNCQAVIMPGEEDFGIVALESNAHGKPVAVYKNSGVAELIKNAQHGIHITSQTTKSVIEAIMKIEKTNFKAKSLIKNSQKYDTNIFVNKFSYKIIQLVNCWERKNDKK